MGHCVSKNLTKEYTTEREVDLVGGNVELVTTKEEWDEKLSEAKRDGRIVIANFSAAWCSPCENIVPFYSSLSVKYPYMMFLTVDVDELSDFSSSMDIKATPTFLILKDGEQIGKLVGANKTELQKKIDALAVSSPLRSL
uniref:Thioredoxin domain-containing protein n=1 Tax=Kalanchoe fedtschenkoi TaxID=63787 RepID=A0A7N0V6U0_KALFE